MRSNVPPLLLVFSLLIYSSLGSVSQGSQNLTSNSDPLSEHGQTDAVSAYESDRPVAVQCPELTSSDSVRPVNDAARQASERLNEGYALRHPTSFRQIDREREIRLLRIRAVRSEANVKHVNMVGMPEEVIRGDIERMCVGNRRVGYQVRVVDSEWGLQREYKSALYMQSLDPSRLRRRGFRLTREDIADRAQCNCSNIRGIPNMINMTSS